MIRFNLRKLLSKLEKELGRKVLLKEVTERSGCDKNALSRMVNHPEIVPSAAVVDKLVQYFFFELKEKYDELYPSRKGNPKWIMDIIIRDFIGVYPDAREYWNSLPQDIQDNPDSVSLDAIWSIYASLNSPNSSSTANVDIKPSSILDAIEPVQIEEDGKYTVKLTLPKPQFEFLRSKIPDMLELLFADPKPEVTPATKSSVKSKK